MGRAPRDSRTRIPRHLYENWQLPREFTTTTTGGRGGSGGGWGDVAERIRRRSKSRRRLDSGHLGSGGGPRSIKGNILPLEKLRPELRGSRRVDGLAAGGSKERSGRRSAGHRRRPRKSCTGLRGRAVKKGGGRAVVGTVRSWIYHQRTSSRGRKLRIIWGGGGGRPTNPPVTAAWGRGSGRGGAID